MTGDKTNLIKPGSFAIQENKIPFLWSLMLMIVSAGSVSPYHQSESRDNMELEAGFCTARWGFSARYWSKGKPECANPYQEVCSHHGVKIKTTPHQKRMTHYSIAISGNTSSAPLIGSTVIRDRASDGSVWSEKGPRIHPMPEPDQSCVRSEVDQTPECSEKAP